jgi:hypothetical protein
VGSGSEPAKSRTGSRHFQPPLTRFPAFALAAAPPGLLLCCQPNLLPTSDRWDARNRRDTHIISKVEIEPTNYYLRMLFSLHRDHSRTRKVHLICSTIIVIARSVFILRDRK